MYEELVKKLRRCGKGLCTEDCPDWTKNNLYHTCQDEVVLEAADAIEELQATLCNWCAVCPEDKRDISTCEIYESCRAKPPREET